MNNQQQGIVLKREFNAPRELVFKVWTDPVHFGNWGGPQGFSLEVKKLDVRPGGEFLEENEGKTLLTLQGGPLNASAEEQEAYNGMAPMVSQGFEGTFEQLANYLASQQ